jgi:hypothetical protein
MATTRTRTTNLASRLSTADRRANAGYVGREVKQSFNRAARAYLRVVLAELLPLLDQDATRVSYNPGGIAIRGEVTCCVKFKGVDLGVYLHIGSGLSAKDAGYWRFSVPSRDVYGTGAAPLHRNRWIDSKDEPEQLAFAIADAARRELDPRFFVAVG